jgi:hypothetical protein
MWTDLVTALRRELSVFDAVLTALLFGAVYLFTDDPWTTVGIAAGVLLAHAFGTLKTAPDVDERWVKVALGVFVTAGGAVLLVLEGPAGATPDLVIPGVFALAGLWLLLDARADFLEGRRFETPDAVDDLDSGEAMLVMQHLRLIADELEDGPKTVPELAAACDLTESRVRQAIDVIDDGTIYRVGMDDEQPRYALDEEKVGLTGLGRQAAGGARGFARRLARPFLSQ